MLYAHIMSSDKENKKSLGSSVASDIRDKEMTEDTMPRSVSNPINKDDEEEK